MAHRESGGQEYFISVDHQDGSAAPEQVMTVQPSPNSPRASTPTFHIFVAARGLLYECGREPAQKIFVFYLATHIRALWFFWRACDRKFKRKP